jgi:NADH:ubiquinone oxidoreductase subunit 5 (subunit L)/multisubunit Na+/H+ antiporter MnhA subunit
MMQLSPALLLFLILGLLAAAFLISKVFDLFDSPKNIVYLKPINTVLMVACLALSGVLFNQVYLNKEVQEIKFFTFLTLPNVTMAFGAYLDRLAVASLCVISFIGVALSIYSITRKGITHKLGALIDASALCGVFLVISNNFIQTFLAIEAIALCACFFIRVLCDDRLLSRFDFKKVIVYQLGSICLLMGIFASYSTFNSFNFSEIAALLKPEKLSSNLGIFGLDIKAIDFICTTLLTGFFAQGYQVLYNAWLARESNSPVLRMLLVQTLIIISAIAFVLIRLLPLIERSSTALIAFALISAVAIIIGKLCMWFGTSMKRIPFDLSKCEVWLQSCAAYVISGGKRISNYLEKNLIYSYSLIVLALIILLFTDFIIGYII